MDKKIFFPILIILIAIGIFVVSITGLIKFFSGEDSWICQNGEWIKHGNPSAPKPTKPCGEQKPSEGELKEEQEVILDSPKTGEAVSSPILIQGRARGFWFFEAIFSVWLIDDAGNELAIDYVEAEGEWMTGDFVQFKGSLNFKVNTTTNATLILEKANPSGLPEFEKKIKVPIVLNPE